MAVSLPPGGGLSPEDAALAMDEWGSSPVRWMADVLGARPWGAQALITNAVRDHRRVAVASCHGIGKDWISARIVLWFLSSYQDSLVLTTGPTDRQVRGILWAEIGDAVRLARRPFCPPPSTKELRLGPRWYAMGFTAPEWDPTKFQGFHAPHILGVVDEAAGIGKNIWDALMALLTGDHPRLLAIGNPTDPTGGFAQLCSDPHVWRLHVSAFQTPNFTAFGIGPEDVGTGAWHDKVAGRPMPAPHLVTPQWVEERYRAWGPADPRYVARVLGQFPTDDEDTLIPRAWIQAARERTYNPGEGDEDCLGVDCARGGGDEATIYHRKGDRVRLVWAGSGDQTQDTMVMTGRVVDAMRRTGAKRAKVDVVGVGAGVVDRLAEQHVPVVAVNAGAGAVDSESFVNARAEWYWALRGRFESGRIDLDPSDQLLFDQLWTIRKQWDSKGRRKIESKDDAKRRGIASPDRADGVMHAFAETEDDYIRALSKW